jgi:hypothetical protein
MLPGQISDMESPSRRPYPLRQLLHRSQPEVAVSADEFSHSAVVILRQIHGSGVTDGQRLQEHGFDVSTDRALQQVADLCDHRARHQQHSPSEIQPGEQLHAGVMIGIVDETGRDQWPCIADDHTC